MTPTIGLESAEMCTVTVCSVPFSPVDDSGDASSLFASQISMGSHEFRAESVGSCASRTSSSSPGAPSSPESSHTSTSTVVEPSARDIETPNVT
ncbi:MAG: hypothetical protein M3323_02300 [Actinomycetota bacterium]|nr:hypothetical protein [Actinomycetota bacterium]